MVYFFIGEDEILKQKKIQDLRQQLFNPRLEPFNYETLYAQDLNLKRLGESLGRLPVSSKNRLLVIKGVNKLEEDLKGYLLREIARLPGYLIIVLDVPCVSEGDAFVNKILKIAKVLRFKSRLKKDAFSLARAVEAKQPDYALNLLGELLRAGERPERILGGLRHHLIKNKGALKDRAKNIAALLEADIRIKTGRLRAEFALEALVVKLCG